MPRYWTASPLTIGSPEADGATAFPTAGTWEVLGDGEFVYHGTTATPYPSTGAGATATQWQLMVIYALQGTPAPQVRLQDVTNGVTLLGATTLASTSHSRQFIEQHGWYSVSSTTALQSALTLNASPAALQIQVNYAGGATIALWRTAQVRILGGLY